MVRIAVIGAGAAGLCAARHISHHDSMSCVVYEQTDAVGGTWRYTEEVGTDKYGLPVHTSMYKSLRTNLPKEVMGFPDFPIPEQDKSYVSAEDILRFLNAYGDHFDIKKYIKFSHHVRRVHPKNKRWEVTVIHLPTEKEFTEEFDAVMVCNGHYHTPLNPRIPGIDTFKGEQLHSHDYRKPDPFKGKSVVVIGAGPSGMDLTLEISSAAKQVIMSHHLPDEINTRFPPNVSQKPDVKCVKGNTVVFEDDTQLETDVLFYCTGYRYSFPFLSEDCRVTVEDNCVQPLYKHLLHIEHTTLCLVGLPYYVCAFTMFDLQTELAESRGHTVQRHVTETEDGVMLTLHRLGDGKGFPVLLLHGLLSASDQWLLRERNQDLASILVDSGYDVWLGNSRGNVYSRAHSFVSPDESRFWNFSWHESGYYDLPAMIEYISGRTGHRKIYFIGYSLGGTFFFVMASTRPEYNQRIRVAIQLAPLVFGAQNRLNHIFRMGMEYVMPLLGGMKNEHMHEFLPRANITLRLMQEICKPESSSHTLCMQFLKTIFGLQPSQYNQDKIHIMLSSFGAGTSLKTIDHILQLLKSGRFCQYDHGMIANMMHYASVSPPEYDLRKVTAPVSVHYSTKDMIVEPAAIDKLVSRLPNVVSKFLNPYSDFSHLDYIFSMNARHLVFNDVLKTLRKF